MTDRPNGYYKPPQLECKGETFRVLLSQLEIEDRIRLMGEEISRDYAGKKPIFIGVLNGAFIFLSDLIRRIDIPCEIDFLKLSSYGDEKVSAGEVKQLKEINADIAGRHVILVDDIVDTGLSIYYLLDRMRVRKPASVAVCSLLHKPGQTRHDVQLDYVGFRIPDRFVLGYGLDFAQEGRNLAQVYVQETGENPAEE